MHKMTMKKCPRGSDENKLNDINKKAVKETKHRNWKLKSTAVKKQGSRSRLLKFKLYLYH